MKRDYASTTRVSTAAYPPPLPLSSYLIEVDNGELIRLPFPHVPDAEVEPLRVLLGVEVKRQVQLVFPLPSV